MRAENPVEYSIKSKHDASTSLYMVFMRLTNLVLIATASDLKVGSVPIHKIKLFISLRT